MIIDDWRVKRRLFFFGKTENYTNTINIFIFPMGAIFMLKCFHLFLSYVHILLVQILPKHKEEIFSAARRKAKEKGMKSC